MPCLNSRDGKKRYAYRSVMARDESPKALTDEIQKNGSLTYDLHLFSANQKSSLKVLTDSLQNARFIKIYCLCQNTSIAVIKSDDSKY